MSIKRVFGMLTTILLAGTVVIISTSRAHASQAAYCTGSLHFNRSQCNGYFTNNSAYDGALSVASVITDGGASLLGVNNANAFIDLMNQRLNAGGPDETGAAFIIDTMLAQPGTSFKDINSGISYAKTHFDAWNELISAYDQDTRGSVDWNANNVPTSFIAPFQDSGQSLSGAKNDEIFYMKQHNESQPVITFFNTDGTTFKIDKASGGLIGEPGLLSQKPVVYYPQVTSQQIQQSQDSTAAQGVVKSFNGTTLVVAIDNPKQTISLTVTSATTYTKGIMYDTATASALKSGSRVVVSYNIKTGNVTQVAYDL